jgi:hypothetical protein
MPVPRFRAQFERRGEIHSRKRRVISGLPAHPIRRRSVFGCISNRRATAADSSNGLQCRSRPILPRDRNGRARTSVSTNPGATTPADQRGANARPGKPACVRLRTAHTACSPAIRLCVWEIRAKTDREGNGNGIQAAGQRLPARGGAGGSIAREMCAYVRLRLGNLCGVKRMGPPRHGKGRQERGAVPCGASARSVPHRTDNEFTGRRRDPRGNKQKPYKFQSVLRLRAGADRSGLALADGRAEKGPVDHSWMARC